jgi:hypothetical protein
MSPHRPENDETRKSLAQRLRRLPPLPAPSGLEGRLLAAIPSRRRVRRARSWLAAAVLLAPAACLLLAIHLPLGVESPAVRIAVAPSARSEPTVWTYEQALRRPGADASVVLDQVAPPFTWPVAGPAMAFFSERGAAPLD